MPGPHTPPDIRDQLCFALYRATHAITRAYRDPLQQLGLTYTQYLVLLALWEHGSLSMGELAQALDLDMGACTPVVKRMELGGLVQRERDGRDERRVMVAPGPQAQALRAPCAQVQQSVAERTGLPVTELRRLLRQLHQVADALRDAEPRPR